MRAATLARMATQIGIVKAAIARLGSEIPQSLNDDVDEIIAQQAIYENLVVEFLCDHEWSFATRWRLLTRSDTFTPPLPWLYAFDIPNGCINVRDAYNECGVPVQYEIFNDRIYSRQEGPLWLCHNWRAPEERWPGDFAGAVEEELLGRLLEAFDEHIRGKEKREFAQAKLSKARRRDRRQKPPFRVDRGPLMRAWHGRATRRQ